MDWLGRICCCGKEAHRGDEIWPLLPYTHRDVPALEAGGDIPQGPIAITAEDIQTIADTIGQAGPGRIYEAMTRICYHDGQLNIKNVQILRSMLVQMAAKNPRVAVFCNPPITQGALDTSAIPQWSDFCRQMASLPAIEIFIPQALGVLAALSEEPQGGAAPPDRQQCEVNLPKLLEILQRSGLGDAGMQILTELFTPHFQSSGVGVADLMCTCHALVNYELMTNPTRLACALVNTGVSRDTVPDLQDGVKPFGLQGKLLETDDPSGGPTVNQLVSSLYQKKEEGSPQAVVGRDPTEVLKSYLGMTKQDTLPSNSHSFTVRHDTTAQSVVYDLPPDTRPSLGGRNTSIATFHCLAPDSSGNLSRPGHTCLALQTQNGDIIFHTNYQDTDQDGKVSVFYVGLTGEGVLSKFSLNPDGNFGVQEPYMLSTHTEQAHHGALAHLEYASPKNGFMELAHEQFSRRQGPGFAEILNFINQCKSDLRKMPNLMPQIFQKLQPKLEILSPPEPPPLPA